MRKFVKHIILWLALVLTFNNITKGEIVQIGPNYFVAGVQSNHFEYFAAPQVYGRQRQTQWCWAATVQMVLNYHGLYVQQEQIVQRIFGQQVNKAGTENDILTALSGWYPDVRGRFSSILASKYVTNQADLIYDLAYRYPLIVGVKNPEGGHAYVLTAVYFRMDNYGRPNIDKVVLRDPSPTSVSRQEWSWESFISRQELLVRVYIQRL